MKKTVYGADAIFRSTDFNLDGVGDNIGFMIKNITVLSNESMDFFSYSMDDTNYMGYLRNFSRANFSDYCLGVAFTYKEFKRSVGGVAWIASSNTHVYPGGICQKQLLMKREKAYFSFNSLVISFFNPWHMLNAETAALTLAHELGHSFGSTHDQMTNSKCRYGDPGGHYLMNHYSSTGELPNNYKFSPCSIRLMYPVIAKKGTCFLRYVGNHCGNGVKKKEKNVTVELQEHVSLMTHAVHLLTLHTGAQTSLAGEKSLGKMCSPASTPCCTNDCKILTNYSKVCKESTECHSQAVCDGIVPWCPEPVRRPNGSMCESETRFCLAGQCAGSICNMHGFSDCLCISKANQCKLCCRKTNSSQCLQAEVLGILSTENKTIFLRYGEPCWNSEAGFCDKDHKCLPYLDFASMVFASESQDNFRLWMLNYWLYLSGGLAFFLVCIFLFIIWSTSYFKDVHMRAVQYGRILAIMIICEEVQFKLHTSMANNDSLLDNLISRIQNGNCPEIFVEAISRLRTLFPTAPLSHLIKTALASTSEDVAVRILLAKGYPMRRFLTKNTSIFSPGGGPENGPHGHQFEQDQQMTNTDQLGFYAPSHLSCQDHPEQPEDKIQHETHRARNKNVSCLEQELTINRHFLVHHFSQSHMQPSDSVQVIHSTDVVYMNLATNSDNIDNVAASSNDGDSDHGSSICGTSVDREPTDFSISISSCSTKHETWLDMSLSAIISTTMSPESGQEASDEQSWFRWFVQKLLDPFRKQEILPETSESCAQCISTSGLKEGESSGIKNMP
ncbi:LOW QUALITY PROTEIN: disintegrin and metalloproteinase domain-containing protein 10-like [Pomacea canaliculata]|uniref:LOW QUALITY PROTEIN: disintegrin and metalloproteinase domain-containing protein 10-like n=1 Tax=Pomacea canaliculata TaxID=400727 RepID=UPI000D72E23C|nr:LOW QUALITY PROTEIN: disintegrin and metalloproteinase domain-containing protein 10-like [Pomacea canaliculata]